MFLLQWTTEKFCARGRSVGRASEIFPRMPFYEILQEQEHGEYEQFGKDMNSARSGR